MRILHVAATLDPAYGGPPSAFNRLAAAQAALGHQVTLLSVAAPGAEQAIARSVASIPCFDRVRRIELHHGRGVRAFFASGTDSSVIRAEVQHADMVHLHESWVPLLVVVSRVARALHRPYCLSTHGNMTPTALARRWWKKAIALRAFGYRTMLDDAAFLAPNNALEAEGIVRLGLRPPVAIVPNGVFLQELYPLPARGLLRSRLGIGDKPLILFLARLHPLKGLDLLAQAFALVARRVPDAQLACIGPDDGMRAPLQRWLAELGVMDRLHLPGPLYGLDKIGALVDADVFVLPSRSEGFSVSIAEAMAVGRAVVITQGCNFPQVEQAGAGRVVPFDPAALAEALEHYLLHPDQAAGAGQKGHALIAADFTWDALARKVCRLYDSHAPTPTRIPATESA
ncbi:MAG: glycosyltransferase [bacterium]